MLTSHSSSTSAKRKSPSTKNTKAKKQKNHEHVTSNSLIPTPTSSSTSSEQVKNLKKFEESVHIRESEIKLCNKRALQTERKEKTRGTKKQKLFDINNLTEWVNQLSISDRSKLNQYVLKRFSDLNHTTATLKSVLNLESFQEFVFNHQYSILLKQLMISIRARGSKLELLTKPKFDFDQEITTIHEKARLFANSTTLNTKYDDFVDDDIEYKSGNEDGGTFKIRVLYKDDYINHINTQIKSNPLIDLSKIFQTDFLQTCYQPFATDLFGEKDSVRHKRDLETLEGDIYSFYSFYALYKQWKLKPGLLLRLETFSRTYLSDKYNIINMDVNRRTIQLDISYSKIQSNSKSTTLPYTSDTKLDKPKPITFTFPNGKYWRADIKNYEISCNHYISVHSNAAAVRKTGTMHVRKPGDKCLHQLLYCCLRIDPFLLSYVLSPWLELHLNTSSLIQYAPFSSIPLEWQYLKLDKTKKYHFLREGGYTTPKKRPASTFFISSEDSKPYSGSLSIMKVMCFDYQVHDLLCWYTYILYSEQNDSVPDSAFVQFVKSENFDKNLLNIICDYIEISRIAPNLFEI